MIKTMVARIKIIGKVNPIRVRIYRRKPREPLMKIYKSRISAGVPIIKMINVIGDMVIGIEVSDI